MAGGSVTIRKDVSGTLVVDITSAAGGTPTFYSDAALTASVSFPDSITTSKTYYIGVSDQYVLSVKRNGLEIANSPDGTRSFRLEDTHLSVSPGPDASNTEAASEGASLTANNAFTGTNSFAAATAVAAGTAALPGVYPTGDTDTGIWSPAADTLAVSTGGTERMRIDTAGLITGTGTSLGAWTAYTPSVTAGSGTPTTASSTGRYCVIGKTCHLTFSLTVTNKGTAGGHGIVTLPFTSANSGLMYTGSGREVNATGDQVQVFIDPNGTTAAVVYPNNATPWIDGHSYRVSVTYEIA